MRRFFDKAAYEKYNMHSLSGSKKKDKLFKGGEGSFYNLGKQHERASYDENVLKAIDKRYGKQKYSDFFYKLDELKDRIEVYNDMFRTNVPSFMRKSRKVSTNAHSLNLQ